MKSLQCLVLGLLFSSCTCHRRLWPKGQVGQECRVEAARRKGYSGQKLARLAMPADQMMLPATWAVHHQIQNSQSRARALTLAAHQALLNRKGSSGEIAQAMQRPARQGEGQGVWHGLAGESRPLAPHLQHVCFMPLRKELSAPLNPTTHHGWEERFCQGIVYAHVL